MGKCSTNLCLVAFAGSIAASATAADRYVSYRCDDANGKRSSQSEIADCAGRYTAMTSGGRVDVLKTQPTPEQLAAAANAKREAEIKEELRRQAERQDRDLLKKYPDEPRHRKLREAELEVVRQTMRRIDARLVQLAHERKPLDDEAEFHKGRPLPPELKRKIDANDAAVAAQKFLMKEQEETSQFINARYDVELEWLKKLWQGTRPGSMGILTLPVRPLSLPSAVAERGQNR
jgi:hypothetical protein